MPEWFSQELLVGGRSSDPSRIQCLAERIHMLRQPEIQREIGHWQTFKLLKARFCLLIVRLDGRCSLAKIDKRGWISRIKRYHRAHTISFLSLILEKRL